MIRIKQTTKTEKRIEMQILIGDMVEMLALMQERGTISECPSKDSKNLWWQMLDGILSVTWSEETEGVELQQITREEWPGSTEGK